MCNCSKPVTRTECHLLRKHVEDPEGRTFIYHVFDDERGLSIAHVPKDKTPNEIAIKNKFIGSDGLPEWYFVREHPCLYEEEKRT